MLGGIRFNAPPLLDADARRAFTETLNENFCVSAGAGAGKTTAIVKRIANLALQRREQQHPLSRLVVVTYAKLAADELRVRTRDRVLRQLGSSAAGRQTLLADLRGAFFGTIHSFCLKLIADHGRVLDLPANAGLLEGREADALWRRFCESDELAAVEFPRELLARVSRHLTFDQLLELARHFAPGEIERTPAFEGEEYPPSLDFSEALAADARKARGKTGEQQRKLRSWQREYESGAAFLPLPEFAGGNRDFLRVVEAAFAPLARWLNAAAGSLAARIARAYRDYRLAKGLMSYDDQVFWCGRLVDQRAVLQAIRERQYIVILDEAQDTDAQMFSILTEITRPVDAPAGAWTASGHAAPPAPGRFSFVGDEQQAIFSDRADLAVYRRYVDAFKSGRGGRHLEFCVTMRCPQRVIDAVNAIFADGRLRQPHVEFRALAPRPGCPKGEAWRMDLGGLREAEQTFKLDARVDREGERLADFLIGQGLAGLGVAKWSEVAIICPRIKWLESAARVFAARGLPVCLLSQKRIAREQARHSWPAALFHVLMHPWDRFELIGVLREIFAVSDVDLALLHRRGGAGGGSGLCFWPDALPKPVKGVPSSRLSAALELLHDLRAAIPGEPQGEDGIGFGTLSRYVERVLRETALAARLTAIGEPPEALDPLIAAALRAECEGLTLRTWADSLVAALEEPAAAQTGSPDAIQFLTCKKAKGLEWPVVIPLALGATLKDRSQNYPCIERHRGEAQIHFSNGTIDPTWKTGRADDCAWEFQRMLYVTLTRAQRLLIVPDGSRLYDGHVPNFLKLALWDELDQETLFDAPPEAGKSAARTAPGFAVGPAVIREPRIFKDDPQLLRRAAIVSQRIPRRLLPSGEVHAGTALAPEAAATNLVERQEATPEPGGIEYGTWWHAVLERYPWSDVTPAERREYIEAESKNVIANFPWGERGAAELARLPASRVHSELLLAGTVFLPEMPFSHPRDQEVWIEGIMDLVVVTRTGVWIVDWKTDRRGAGESEERLFLDHLAAKYGPQLRPYAEVFSKGFRRPVERLLIYSTTAGAVVDVRL